MSRKRKRKKRRRRIRNFFKRLWSNDFVRSAVTILFKKAVDKAGDKIAPNE